MTEDEAPTLQTEMRGISHIQSFKQCYLLKLKVAPTIFHAMLHHPGELLKKFWLLTPYITTEQSCGTTLHEEMENTCKRYVLVHITCQHPQCISEDNSLQNRVCYLNSTIHYQFSNCIKKCELLSNMKVQSIFY